jgi:hypothetical protein
MSVSLLADLPRLPSTVGMLGEKSRTNEACWAISVKHLSVCIQWGHSANSLGRIGD